MSEKKLSAREKKLFALLGVAVALIVVGILFLVNAMGMTDFFKGFAALSNALAKYIVVIVFISAGVLIFSNVAPAFESDRLRNGLTIGITVFAFVLTVPLVYVFIALLPFAANHDYATVKAAIDAANANPAYASLAESTAASADALGMGGIGKIMGLHTIYAGFCAWFGTGAGLWIVLVLMVIVGVVFLAEPVAACVCILRGKILMLFSKDEEGKFHVVYPKELPVLKARRENEVYENAL